MNRHLTIIIALLLSIHICWGQSKKDTTSKEAAPKTISTDTNSHKRQKIIKNTRNPLPVKAHPPVVKEKPPRPGIGKIDTRDSLTIIDTMVVFKDSLRLLNKELAVLRKRVEKLEADNGELLHQRQEGWRDPEPGTVKPPPLNRLAGNVWIFVKVLGVLLAILIILYFFLRKKPGTNYPAALRKQPASMTAAQKPGMPSFPHPAAPATTTHTAVATSPAFSKNRLVGAPPAGDKAGLRKSFSHIQYPAQSKENTSWYIVGASSIGKTHIMGDKPCQDNHFCAPIKNGWGIAVVSDGAGSSEYAELGSEFVSRKAFELFRDALVKNKWVDKNKLPAEDEWKKISAQALNDLYDALEGFAKSENHPLAALACTLIVVVFTPIGLLSIHIGDGRAGYCNERGEWKSLLTPHKGEESNLTIFITSPWRQDSLLNMSGVSVPEIRVILGKPIAFTLMSDGCETHSFDCSKMDNESNKWIDPNLPAEKFFNPLVGQLRTMHEKNVTMMEANHRWEKFLEAGIPGLKDEPDDKTFILGILI